MSEQQQQTGASSPLSRLRLLYARRAEAKRLGDIAAYLELSDAIELAEDDVTPQQRQRARDRFAAA